MTKSTNGGLPSSGWLGASTGRCSEVWCPAGSSPSHTHPGEDGSAVDQGETGPEGIGGLAHRSGLLPPQEQDKPYSMTNVQILISFNTAPWKYIKTREGSVLQVASWLGPGAQIGRAHV